MTDDRMTAARHICNEWHRGFTTGDMKAVAALYAEDTVFESPTILSVCPNLDEAVLHGRDAVQELFEKLAAGLKGAFAELYRTGIYYCDGQYLTWEYLRVTPTGSQVDISESIDIRDGLTAHHRVYMGWRGVKDLIALRDRRATRGPPYGPPRCHHTPKKTSHHQGVSR
jgi:steroid delta-isomerase